MQQRIVYAPGWATSLASTRLSNKEGRQFVKTNNLMTDSKQFFALALYQAFRQLRLYPALTFPLAFIFRKCYLFTNL